MQANEASGLKGQHMGVNGKVYLVGAGPGDPGLLTRRGAELIALADVIISDALVNPALLALAPESCKIIFAGKRSKLHVIPQEELNELLVEYAREGKTVVRLKGGDPFLFGRGGEEAESMALSEVPFEIVPGVTSISAVPAYAGIPTTHRDHCSSITVLTGHEQPGKSGSKIDWGQLAQEPGTKIILMGIERLGSIVSRLRENGLKSETPVALVRWGTTSQQETLTGTLTDIADKAEQANFCAPAVIIIGSVVNLRKNLTGLKVALSLGSVLF
ncbi:MAG: uroporphyrinogen-III C-methyltransferase [Verrucomicrobiota bacterium]|nr:uroporphyrinogen-III C-methyltransferase [Verrucomicrobiota bacterium]